MNANAKAAVAETNETVKAAAKETTAKKAVKKAEPTVAVYVQYQGVETETAALVEAARAAFRAEKKRARIDDIKVYVKPEERTAYYVVNGTFEGKVAF